MRPLLLSSGAPFALAAALLAAPAAAQGADHPACLKAGRGSPREAIEARGVSEQELLARLGYAEGGSTGFGEDPLVFQAIAWGVMNRVRLARASPLIARQLGRGVAGVIFKAGQSNPAVSPRSRFSRDFLCPVQPARWQLASPRD